VSRPAYSEGLSPLGILVHALFPGLLFLASALLAWRRATTGSWLLLGEGLLVAIAYPLVMRNMPPPTVVFIMITMALPPAVSGLILLLQAAGRRPSA